MLQYIATVDDRYSIPEQIQMVSEGGCAWVQLRVPGMADADIRELAREVVPLCKETQTILVIEDHEELARELGLHGVHLSRGCCDAAAVRELLGPEAIIGVQVAVPSDFDALKGVDVDYATFGPMPEDRLKDYVDCVRAAGVQLPVVAFTDGTDPAALVRATGCSGVAVHGLVASADDPVAETRRILVELGIRN